MLTEISKLQKSAKFTKNTPNFYRKLSKKTIFPTSNQQSHHLHKTQSVNGLVITIITIKTHSQLKID